MKNYKYLLFDADNTLFDFDKCEKEAFKLALEGSPIKYTEEIYRIYHIINDNLWKRLEKGQIERSKIKVERYRLLYERLGVEGDSYIDVSENYFKFLGKQNFEIKETYGVLEKLYGKYSIYVITNGITDTQKNRFASSRITEFIDKIYISEQMGVAKPFPEFFDLVVGDIRDCDRNNYLVIGDSLTSDIDGAIASGIDSCWYNPGGADCGGRNITYTISNLEEIFNILSI